MYARVTINFTVHCLKPWVLKWKKVFRVDCLVLSNPGVTLYYLSSWLQLKEIIVRLFISFLNRNLRWSRLCFHHEGNRFCMIYWKSLMAPSPSLYVYIITSIIITLKLHIRQNKLKIAPKKNNMKAYQKLSFQSYALNILIIILSYVVLIFFSFQFAVFLHFIRS